jgi:hypothetical protein
VSVLAPAADFASRRSCSSMWRVFFIHLIVPYVYGCSLNTTNLQEPRARDHRGGRLHRSLLQSTRRHSHLGGLSPKQFEATHKPRADRVSTKPGNSKIPTSNSAPSAVIGWIYTTRLVGKNLRHAGDYRSRLAHRPKARRNSSAQFRTTWISSVARFSRRTARKRPSAVTS